MQDQGVAVKWIGLTGGIATGKSTAANMFRELQIPVIDADQLARDAVRPGTRVFDDVIHAFGRSVIGPDGGLDRKALGDHVFGNSDRMRVLEQIIHPEVRRLQKEVREALAAEGSHDIAIYDVPLLFEKNLDGDFDATVVVVCDSATQLKRLMERNGLKEADAVKRINSQLPIADKIKRADFVVDNRTSFDALRAQIAKLVPQLKSFTKPTSSQS